MSSIPGSSSFHVGGPIVSSPLGEAVGASRAERSRPSLSIFDNPADLPGAVPEPRSDLPPLQRERAVASAMARSSEPPAPRAAVDPERAKAKLAEAAGRLKEARQEGVELAKMGFWKKVINVATAVVSVGVAAALSAASFGLATPLLAVACVNLAVTVGDVVCAHRNVKNALALAEGREPPYHLPGGNSCVKNLLHGAATSLGASKDAADTFAKYGGGLFQLGLGVTAFALGQATGALPAAHKAATLVANGVNALLAGGTAMRTGVIESRGENGEAGYTQRLLDDALRAAQEARALDPNVDAGDDVEQQRMLAVLDDPAMAARAERIVSEQVRNYGDAVVNTAIATAGIVGVGKALLFS